MKRLVPPALVVLLLVAWYACDFRTGPVDRTGRSFDPLRMAAHELSLWRGYAGASGLHQFRMRVGMLQEQYDLSWSEAARIAYFIAEAEDEYSQPGADLDHVAVQLEKGYVMLQHLTEQPFDARNAARLELALWDVRRVWDQPRRIAEVMADQYAEIFQLPVRAVLEPAALRASAWAEMEGGGDSADWGAVRDYLEESYRSLHVVLNEERTPRPAPPPEPTAPPAEEKPRERYP